MIQSDSKPAWDEIHGESDCREPVHALWTVGKVLILVCFEASSQNYFRENRESQIVNVEL